MDSNTDGFHQKRPLAEMAPNDWVWSTGDAGSWDNLAVPRRYFERQLPARTGIQRLGDRHSRSTEFVPSAGWQLSGYRAKKADIMRLELTRPHALLSFDMPSVRLDEPVRTPGAAFRLTPSKSAKLHLAWMKTGPKFLTGSRAGNLDPRCSVRRLVNNRDR